MLKLTSPDFVTTTWSGGKTTQLAIAPDGASYAERAFLWRISSATVELEASDFTPLPVTMPHGFICVLTRYTALTAALRPAAADAARTSI